MLLWYLLFAFLASSWAKKEHKPQIPGCFTAPSVPRDTRTNKSVLRIGTFNAEWLFLDQWSKRWSSFAEAQEHLLLMAGVLKELNFDVLNLVEVESCDVLQKLITAIGDPTYRAYLIPGTDSATGQNVALLTRVDPVVDLWRTESRVSYPVSGNTCGYSGSGGTSGVSKHYFTLIEPIGFPPIFLASAHFLAFPDRADRCVQREAQARVIQNVLAQQMKSGYEIVAFGDFNDWDGQVLDARSSKPISRVLTFLKDADPSLPASELNNAAVMAQQPQRYTAYYSPSGCLPKELGSSSIDHVLLSPGLLSLMGPSNPFQTQVFTAPCATTKPYSDHWPILVQLTRR